MAQRRLLSRGGAQLLGDARRRGSLSLEAEDLLRALPEMHP